MVAFEKKDTTFAQGDATDGLSFIQKGKVQLSVVSEGGKEATLGILSEGDFFGAAYRCRQFPCSQTICEFWESLLETGRAGFSVWCVGQTLGTYYGSILNVETQRLWAVDVFYNTWTAPLIMCLFLDPEAESEGLDWARILDFTQIAIFVVLVYLYFSRLAARNQTAGDWRLALTMDGLTTAGFFLRARWAKNDPEDALRPQALLQEGVRDGITIRSYQCGVNGCRFPE